MRSPIIRASYLVAIGTIFAAGTLQAADQFWNNSTGGLFNVPANWLGAAAPVAGDTATFNLSASYAVTLSAPATVSQIFVDHDALTLDLGGSTLTTTTTLFTQPSLTIGQSSGAIGSLILQNGAFIAPTVRVGDYGIGSLTLANASVSSSDTLYVGFRAGSSGMVSLTGSDVSYASLAQDIGDNGNGILTVSGGASLVSTSGSGVDSTLGVGAGSHGTVIISGPGSSWTGPQNYVSAGYDGQGVLSVNILALLSCYVLTIGQDPTGTGSVSLDGASSLGRSTISTVSDAIIGNSGKGTVTITNGALFAVGGNLSVGVNSSSSGLISMASASAGVPAALTVGGSLSLGYAGGAGLLSLGSGASVSVAGPTNVGGFGKGTLSLTGGTLSTHGLLVWSGGILTHSSGVLIIDHGLYQPAPGSLSLVGVSPGAIATLRLIDSATLTQTGALFVGGTSAANGPGAGILSLESNATATFSGATRLWPNGTLDLAGGMLKTSSLTLSGGLLSFTAGGLLLTNSNFTLGATGLFGAALSLSNATSSRNTLAISGTTTCDPGSSLTLNGGSFSTGKIVNNGVALAFNTGSLAITNDSFTVGAGALLGANVDLLSGQSLSVSGAVTINPGAALAIDGGAFSAGALVNNGSFAFNSGTIGGSADIVLDPGQLLGSSLTLSPGRNLTASQGLIVGKIGAATLTLAGGTASSARGYLAQQVGSSGLVILSGTASQWSISSTFAAGGSDTASGGNATLSITAGASLLAGSTVTLYPSSNTLVDSATLGGSTILNRGILRLADSARVSGNVTNTGSITMSGGGDASISGTLSNAASVQVLGGTLSLAKGAGTSTGSFVVNAPATLEFAGLSLFQNTSMLGTASSLTGTGTALFSSGAHAFAGVFNLAQVTVGDSSLVFNANATAGHLTLTADQTPSYGAFSNAVLSVQTADLTGGTLGGTGTVTIAGSLNITGTEGKALYQGTINVAGSTLWTGEASVLGINRTTFNNLASATFEARSSATGEPPAFGSTIFNNYGGFVKSTGNGAVEMNTIFNNYGSVSLQNGRLDFTGGGTHAGSFTAAAGTTLSFSSTGNPAGTTFAASSSLSSAGDVAFADNALNLSGLYAVAGNTTFDQTFNFLPGADIQSLGAALLVRGTVNFSTGMPQTLPATTLSGRLAGSDVLTLPGPFTWTTESFDSNIDDHIRLAGQSTFTESGVYNKYLNGTLDNASYITWTSGTIIQKGTFNNLAGATFDVQGQDGLEIDFSSPNPLPQFNNAGLLVKSAGNTTNIYPFFNNTGSVQVQAGALYFGRNSDSTGSYSVGPTAALGFTFGTHTLEAPSSITGAGSLLFDATLVTLRGTVNVTGPTSMGSSGDSNPAQITAEKGASLVNLGTDLTIWNNATLTLNTGSDVAFHNLTLLGKINGSDRIIVDGVLSGVGSITAPTVNAGQLSPGSSPGTLMINADYTQEPQALLDIELAPASLVGPKYTQQFDVLIVNGAAHLAGTLDLTELDGFVPDIGATFPILTYASHTGQFDTVVGQELPQGRQYELLYTNTGLTLTVAASVPEPASLALLAVASLFLFRRPHRKRKTPETCRDG